MKVIGIHTTNDVTVIRARRWWFWFDEWALDRGAWQRLRDGKVAPTYPFEPFGIIEIGHERLTNALEASQLREKVYGAT